MNFTKKDKIEIFENAISWVVVFAMFLYGGAKLFQFNGAAEVDKTVAEMSGMELMWAFYGYSKAFAITLGVFEVLGGFLLLFKKTRIVGCLFITTILLNVILQDIYFGVHLGALSAAIIYQILILIILWLNKGKVVACIKILLTIEESVQTKSSMVSRSLIAFGLFFGLRILEYLITIKWLNIIVS